MTSSFNEEVQLDLLFYHPICDPNIQGQQVAIMHIIDMTTRFAAARIAPSKSEEDLCQTISEAWITHHGPPRTIISDEETSLHGKVTADFAERHGADLVFKAP
eukprot:3484085-Amphidinium_carterae.1